MALQRGIRIHQYLDDWSTSPSRSTPYQTHRVALKKQLEGTRITGKGNTSPQVAPPPLKVVAGGKQCAFRSTITPTKTCSADIYRRIKRRVGRSLKQTHCKGKVVNSRKQVAHKSLGTKGGLSGPKRVPRPLFKQHSPSRHRQHNSGCLYQQRGGMKSGSLCALCGESCPGAPECDSRQAIQTWPDNSNRVVPSPKVFQAIYSRWHKWTCLPPDSTTNSHSLCHQSQTPRLG